MDVEVVDDHVHLEQGLANVESQYSFAILTGGTYGELSQA
jgi:hypothetical protein